MRDIGRLFDQARDSADGFEPYADQLGEAFADNRGMLEDVLAALFVIARADGPVNGASSISSRRMHRGFGLDQTAWDRARGAIPRRPRCRTSPTPMRCSASPAPRPTSRLRAAWKRLMRENHPDSLASRGVPQEFIARAEREGRPDQRRLGPHQARAGPVSPDPREPPHPRPAQPEPGRPPGRRADRHADPALHRHADGARRRSTGCATRGDGCPRTMSSRRTARSCAWCRRSGAPGTPASRIGAGTTELNGRSIGIEIVNPGHEWGYRDFPVLQIAAVCDLCLAILVAPPDPGAQRGRPQRRRARPQGGPGREFDWAALAQNGVGLWPEDVPDLGTGGAVRDAADCATCARALADIGYRVAPEGALDPALSAVLRAFQRHWRPEAITGQADSGTLARLLGVARLCQGEG